MNRSAFLAALAGAALTPRSLAAAEEENPEDKVLLDLLDAILDAQFKGEFPRLASYLHPRTRELFRNDLSAHFDLMLEKYPLPKVLTATNLPAHPKDQSATDEEFFILACERAKEREPDFVGNPDYLPLNVHGLLFEQKIRAFVVYSYSGNVHTKRTDYDYQAASALTFRKVQATWLLWTCVLAGRVTSVWTRQLAGLRKVA